MSTPQPPQPPVPPQSPVPPQPPVPPTAPVAGAAPHGGQPGFPPAAPGAPAPAPAPSAPSTGRGIGIASLVLGIASLVLAIVLGFVLGVVAVILGFIGLKRPAARGLSIGGLITGGIGILLSLVLTVAIAIPVIIGVSDAWREAGEKAASQPTASASEEPGGQTTAGGSQTVTTPCYSFDGPAAWVNNISSDEVDACNTSLELWGEQDPDGTIVETGVGSVWGGVTVQAVSSGFVASIAPSGTLDDIVSYLETDYWAANDEEVAQLRAPFELDGADANLTLIVPDTAYTKTRVYISALPAAAYPTASDDAAFFLITVSTPYDDGEDLLNQVINSWRWA